MTVDRFVGIVIGMNIVVFVTVIEIVGDIEINEFEAVLAGVELPSGVLDNEVDEIMVVDGPDIVTIVEISFEGTIELLAVVLDIITDVPIWVLAIELVIRVFMCSDGSAELLIGLVAVIVGILLIVTARLEATADVTVTVLEDGANVTMAAVVEVAAVAEGTLTVMPDKLAHSWTNALPKSSSESALSFRLSTLLLTLT